MLGMNKYPRQYIDDCQVRVKAQVAAYRKLVKAARKEAGTDEAALNPAIDAFEPVFFNNMVLVLDGYFVHRIRGLEGKDGNPLNEVRILCNSLMLNKGVVSADKSIRMNPEKSVLKYEVGDKVSVTEADFSKLSKAFFAEIESKFS